MTSFIKIESSSFREIEVNMAGATKKVTTFVVLVENKVWKPGSRLAGKWST